AGAGPLETDLKAKARALGLGEAVRFLGLVPNERVAALVGAADLFALSSVLEATPTVALEALACGTPVISTDNPGGLELRGIFGDDVAVVARQDPAALAEESTFAVGLDLDARFLDSGTRLVRERGVRNAAFVQGDGARLPFRASAFDAVFSHSVIEHVSSAPAYLAECHRVLRPGGVLYLSTAPYLSLAGAHLPRLLVPVPLHLLVGRRVAFGAFRLLARRAPWLLREPKEANTFIALAEQGKSKRDDLLQRV